MGLKISDRKVGDTIAFDLSVWSLYISFFFSFIFSNIYTPSVFFKMDVLEKYFVSKRCIFHVFKAYFVN